MHGEYKMPGGKLIVVDLDVDKACFSRVQISGDFFIQPETTLDALNQALNGLATSTADTELKHQLDSALPAEVMLYGISTDAIVVAVKRALEAA